MKQLLRYLAGSWRAWAASGAFVIGAELWHREELRIAALRTREAAEEITRQASGNQG